MALSDAQGAAVSVALLLMSVWFGTLRFTFPICKKIKTPLVSPPEVSKLVSLLVGLFSKARFLCAVLALPKLAL